MGVDKFNVVVVLATAVFLLLLIIDPTVLPVVARWVFMLLPLWLPPLLFVIGWEIWMQYVQAKFLAKTEHVLLEIRIPRDIEKSPRAMELVFAGIHNVSSGEATFINRWIEGKVRPWWSFEIVSDQGRIRFFVWVRKGLREYTEAQLYAQYPGIEIYEVEDYAAALPYTPATYGLWGCNFILNPGKPDAYPIKTYVDYELDKDPKEEFKIDPIAHLFEALSTLKQGEFMWIQVLIRSNKDKRKKKDAKTGKVSWFEEEDRWKSEAKDEIAKIRDAATPKRKDKDGNEVPGFMVLSPSDDQKIKAIERSLDKVGFDTGIRGIYLAEDGHFNGARIAGMTGVFKQFSSGHLNSIIPTGYGARFDFPWQKWFGAEQKDRYAVIDAYKRRSWFHRPHKTKHFVMTSEELATIYHFPSRTIMAPGLDRIPAKKAEAPPNLPFI